MLYREWKEVGRRVRWRIRFVDVLGLLLLIADFPSRQRYYAVQTEVNGSRGSVYAGSSADTPKFAVMAIAHSGKTRDDSAVRSSVGELHPMILRCNAGLFYTKLKQLSRP